jgi:4-hydroxy-tetrahydrodipicolinate reductase
MNTTRVAIHGAAGRMGKRLVAMAATDPALRLVAALDSPDHPQLGTDAGLMAGMGTLGVPLSAKLDHAADVVVDFSVPAAAESILETCLGKKVPLVLATTGFNHLQAERIRATAKEIAVLWSPSMSVAVNLTMRLAELAGKALADKDTDVEIVERHHRFKEDAPSGTALKFGQIIAQAMGQSVHRHGREGRPGIRPHNEIGYHAVRLGDNPGEHTIIFGMLGETIELTVKASSRDCYAAGALAAAKFLAHKPAGLYSMNDVLGF